MHVSGGNNAAFFVDTAAIETTPFTMRPIGRIIYLSRSLNMFKDIALIVFAIAALTAVSNAQSVDLTGTWLTGGLSTTDDVNTVTGARTSSNGNTMKYDFKADGRFAFVGYLQSTMYGCTTALFQDKQGKYSLEGDQLTLTLTKNFWSNTYSCAPRSNKERDYTLGTEVYRVSNKSDEYGKQYICLANEKGESCYRREN
jgi:hypothetical protein